MFITDILKSTLFLFLEMAPYLMLGLSFVGLFNLIFRKDFVAKHIGKDSFASIFKAALLGIPLPLCSCGVIPSAVFMSKNGASKPAVVSFLISTPQTGVDSLIATYGMMGPVFAIFRPIAAFMMGIIGGIITKLLNKKDLAIPAGKSFVIDDYDAYKIMSIWQRILQRGLRYPFIEFIDDISTQLIFGLLAAGFITYLVPENFFSNYNISHGIIGMLIVIALAGPMYVCATASIPIAVSLIMKGFSPGIAFVFLAAGPATNAASVIVLSKVLGKKITGIFIGSVIILSVIFGFILDKFFEISGINPHEGLMHIHHNHMENFSWLQLLLSGIFLILLIGSVYRKYIYNKISKKEGKIMELNKTKVNIEGMTCNHCVMNVKKAITGTTGVTNVEVSLPDNAAYVEGDFKMMDLKKAVEDMGYVVIDK